MASPKDIVNKTFNLGSPASTITDHGNLFCTVDHYEAAKDIGQKFIAGFEAYIVGNYRERTNEGENARHHLLLLAKNEAGYKNIVKWCSTGATDGFYYKPRIDDSVFEETGTEGVICSSACIGSSIAQAILNNQIDKAEEKALYYKNLFENFYLEIQPTNDEQQVKVNIELIRMSQKLNIPLLATADSHYLNREDSITHDVLLA